MSYSTPGAGPIIVGQPYSIKCTVTTVENVFGDNPTMQWMDPNGAVISTTTPDVRVGQMMVTSNVASLELIFNSFEVAQAGMYACQGCVNVLKASTMNQCADITADTTLSGPCKWRTCSICAPHPRISYLASTQAPWRCRTLL